VERSTVATSGTSVNTVATTRGSLRERAGAVYAQSGWSGVWFGALAVTAYRRLTIVERRLDLRIENLEESQPIDTRLLGPADEDEFNALRRDAPPGQFRERLDRGEICVGAWSEGRLAASGWLVIARAPIPYLGTELALGSAHAWAYGGFTDPALRSLGIGTARLTRLLEEASALGAERVSAALLPENRAAVAPFRRTGWSTVGAIRAFRASRSWTVFARTPALDG
jgi:GNAT superfamily N-acetyltransferase